MRGSLALLVLLCGLAVAGNAGAALDFRPCAGSPSVGCASLRVPLDRRGPLPGTVDLHVERFRTAGEAQGTLVLVPGGPGQSATGVFDPFTLYWFATLLGDYETVAFDPRGTGRSSLLSCPGVQGADEDDLGRLPGLVAACAASLGDRRHAHATLDHVDDLEAIRQALGVERIALAGFSWGGRVAQAYALRYPEHVERLLLVSPAGLEQSWQASGEALRVAPRVLDDVCSGPCALRVPGFAARVVAVANRLGARGRTGLAADERGRLRRERLRGLDLVGLLLATDVDPAVAALLPDAVAAAERGDLAPLLRLRDAADAPAEVPERELSGALFLATTCSDTAFPWRPVDPLAARRARLARALRALPAGATGPFGRWALDAQQALIARLCLGWPGREERAPLPDGDGPDVPVLVVSGSLDLRTPLESTAAVRARFPGARVVEARGLGHTPLSPLEPCLAGAVRAWASGAAVPDWCPRSTPAIEAPPAAVAPPPGARGRALAEATLEAVAATVADAAAIRLVPLLEGGAAPVGGLRGGLLRPLGDSRFRLAGYAAVAGVRLDGVLTVREDVVEGRVRVRGARALAGSVELRNGELVGRFGELAVTVEREVPAPGGALLGA